MDKKNTLVIRQGDHQHRFTLIRPRMPRYNDPYIRAQGRSCYVYTATDEADPSKRFLIKCFKDAYTALRTNGREHPAEQASACIRSIREAFRERGDNYLLGDALLGTDGGEPPVYYHVFPLLNSTAIEDVTLIDEYFVRVPTKENLERVLRLADGFLTHLGIIHDAGWLHNDIKPDNLIIFKVNGEEQMQLIDFDSAISMEAWREKSPSELRDFLVKNSSERAMFGADAYTVYESKDIDELARLGTDAAEFARVPDIAAAAKIICYLLFGAVTLTMTDEYDALLKVYPGAARLLRRIIWKATVPDITQRYKDAASLAKDLRCVSASLLTEPTDFRTINAYLRNANVLLQDTEDLEKQRTFSFPPYDTIDTTILPNLRCENHLVTGNEGRTPLEVLLKDEKHREKHLFVRGDGGGGKSTTLGHAFIHLLLEDDRQDNECIFYYHLKKKEKGDVQTFLRKPEGLNLTNLSAEDRKITVFFDALDESKISFDELAAILREYGHIYRYVITSRDKLPDKTPEDSGFVSVDVEPLSEEQTERYLAGYHIDPEENSLLYSELLHTPIMLTMYKQILSNSSERSIQGPASLIYEYLRSIVIEKVGQNFFSEQVFENFMDGIAMVLGTGEPNGVTDESHYLEALQHIITLQIMKDDDGDDGNDGYDKERKNALLDLFDNKQDRANEEYEEITSPWRYKGEWSSGPVKMAVSFSHNSFYDYFWSRYDVLGIEQVARAIRVKKNLPRRPSYKAKREKLDRIIFRRLRLDHGKTDMKAEMIRPEDVESANTIFRHYGAIQAKNRFLKYCFFLGILLAIPVALCSIIDGYLYSLIHHVNPFDRICELFGSRDPSSPTFFLGILSIIAGVAIAGILLVRPTNGKADELWKLSHLVMFFHNDDSYKFHYHGYRRSRNRMKKSGYYVGNDEGHVDIPKRIKKIEYRAFEGQVHIRSVTMQNTVTSIGPYAFQGCLNLESIDIPESVRSIGHDAFQGCRSLKKIQLPSTGITIEDRAFRGCTSLSRISIPDSAKLKFGVFEGCTRLRSCSVPFEYPYDDIPASEITVRAPKPSATSRAENGGVSLSLPVTKTLILEEGIKGIESLYAPELRELVLPRSLSYISSDVFASTKKLKIIRVSEAKDGAETVSTSLPTDTPIEFPSTFGLFGSRLEYIEIPPLFNAIHSGAFSCQRDLRTVMLPPRIKTLAGTFEFCTSLTEVKLPELVEDLQHTFWGCTSLVSVRLPDSLRSINGDAFRDCVSLTGIDFPNRLVFIAATAFLGCTNLTAFGLPSRAPDYQGKEIGLPDILRHYIRELSSQRTAVKTIRYRGPSQDWDADGVKKEAFEAFPSLTAIICEDGVTLSLND